MTIITITIMLMIGRITIRNNNNIRMDIMTIIMYWAG